MNPYGAEVAAIAAIPTSTTGEKAGTLPVTSVKMRLAVWEKAMMKRDA